MKKYGKFIVLAVATFLSSILPCFAKQMTIDDLEAELKEKVPDAGYVYIIGEYAFTSEHTIDLTDIVLASDSINNKGDKTDKTQVNIYQLIRKYDGDYNAIGLEKTTNVIGTGVLPQTFDIRYIDYKHIGETTETKVEFDIDNPTYNTYQDVLEKKLGFKTSEFYSGKLTNENGKIKGILLKKSVEDVSLNDDDKAKYAKAQYFLAYIIEVPGATNETTIKKTGFDRKAVDIPLSAFDVPVGSTDKTPGIVILTPIDLGKIKDNKKIIYTIDLDGDKDLYDPYDYVIDISEVTFQTDSKATINETNEGIVTQADKDTFTDDWGYHSELNSGVKITPKGDNTYKVSGNLVEQTLNPGVYSEGQTGYYFDFTFVLENNKDNKAVISSLTSAENRPENIKKTFKPSEYDENGNLTILIRIDPSKDCKDGSCKAYYSVDLDGPGDEYLPVIYTIDYSGDDLIKVKASLFEVNGVTANNKGKFDNADWFTEDYKLDAMDDSNAKLFKATGLLPLLNDDSNWDSEEKFDAGSYYMGLALKLTNAPEIYEGNDLKVKLTNSLPFIQKYDKDSKTIYLLVGLTKDSSTKEFTITLDLDDGSEEYAPYDVTVNYENVSFQTVTEANPSYEKLDLSNLAETPEKSDLVRFGFNSKTVEGLQVTNDGGSGKIAGKVKEQTLDQNASGFRENTGYFAPVKISVDVPEEYKNTWTMTLYDEDRGTKVYSPNETEREQNWVLVVFKLKSDKTELKYKIDFDGEGKAFIEHEYTIKVELNDADYLTENKVTFNYFDETSGTIKTEEKIVYATEKLSSDDIPNLNNKDYKYHTFEYWYETSNGSSSKVDEISTKVFGKDEDLDLTAHYIIDSDKFIGDVVNHVNDLDTLDDAFTISKDGTDITIKVLNQDLTLADLKKTKIYETIDYVLKRKEIEQITVTTSVSSSETITNGENVSTKIEALFTKNFSQKKLVDMARDGNTFTIKISMLSDSVKLKEVVQTEYTFKFVSDVVGVSSEDELNNALTIGNASHIQITGDFEVTSPHEVNKNVVINGLHEDNNYTITAGSEVANIFNVNSSNVTIENINLKGATEEAIILTDGSLTTDNVKIEYDDSLPGSVKAGIKVEAGTLTATNMTFAKEHYNTPLVKAKDNTAKVTLTDMSGLTAEAKNRVVITPQTNKNDTMQEFTDDGKYYHNYRYNSKIYTTELMTHEGGARHHIKKLNYYNEVVGSIDGIKEFNEFASEGKVFTLYGYQEKSYDNLYSSKEEIPETVIEKGKLRATSDAGYWAVYTVKADSNVTIIESDDKEALKQAIEKAGTEGNPKTIYIKGGVTIHMGDEPLAINNNVSIYSSSSSPATITNVGKITISANDVSFNRINLEVKGESAEGSSLIEVTGKKFSFWQGGLKNTGNEVDYAIKYTNAESVVDIRYMGIGGSTGFDESNNISEAYIYVEGISDGSDLYINTFPKGPKGVIEINGFKGASKEDDIYGIRFLGNTVRTEEYAMKLTSNVSGQEGDIRFGKGKIIVEYDTSHKQFNGIDLLVDNLADPTITYKNVGQDGSLESPTPPEDGSGINISTSVQSSSPIETSISGISKNAYGSYSGTITQNEDGNFYLPLVITSSELKDRVSKIKITDPNDKVTEYLYSTSSDNGYTTIANVWPLNALSKIETISEPAVSQNNGTMKINLEALKAVKTKDNKKVYTIAFDYDGDGTYDEPQTIDYTDVKTEEEIILYAAYNTKEANSFTVIKNNKIKSGTENYTFKVDLANGNKYYKEKGQDIEQYSFKATSVGLETDTIYVVEKSANIDSPIAGKEDLGARPKLNDWTYFTHFKSVSSGIQELGLLTDIVPDNKEEIIDAIATVSRISDTHSFNVKVNHVRLEKWLNGMYVDGKALETGQDLPNEEHDVNEDSTIILKVTLDETEKYVTHIQTISEFNIKNNEGDSYNNNKIDVQFNEINNTEVSSPQQLFDTDNKNIQAFIEQGKAWWNKYTGSSKA